MFRFSIGLAIALGCLSSIAPPAASAHAANMRAAAPAGGNRIFSDGFENRAAKPANILLVIMDDVGMDQMGSFGYGGAVPPSMPSIEAIADGGLRFRNTWSMPECSPGRSALFAGRYPLRNNILQAIGPNDLANSQLGPFEVTAPKMLADAGYESAMFGKFHLAGPEHNQAEHATPTDLGWDDFYGWLGGLPGSIDTTAGGVGAAGDYSCGFVPDTVSDPVKGADVGACYVPDSSLGFSCSVLIGNDPVGDPPGLRCATRGGILVPGQACQSQPPAYLVWERENAHFVSPLVVNHDGVAEVFDLGDPRGRGYRSTIEVDAAIDWIQERANSNRPWMATVSFSAPHTPLQRPPGTLLRSNIGRLIKDDCSQDDPVNLRLLSDAMIEAMDAELGRLLVDTGIGEALPGGGVAYDPSASDTVIVIYGDNGSFGPTVKLPFDPTRAKGTTYQTGVWVPLVVSGPMVVQPGRAVEHMVNGVDVFRLFGEVAGLEVPALVPRTLDSESMLPYLTNPQQGSLRNFNFAQAGLNQQANGARNGPCVISGQCTHIPTSQGVCRDNGGIWWGIGADPDEVLETDLEHCWQVNRAIYRDDPGNYQTNRLRMAWNFSQAMRNEHFKLIRNHTLDYDPITDDGVQMNVEEFYLIDQAPLPRLDTADRDLLAGGVGNLGPIQMQNYVQLSAALDTLLDSQVACPGDGNDDGVVDQQDLDNYYAIVSQWSGSSTYDFNLDGVTDADDLVIIQDNLGTVCLVVP